MRNTAKGGLHTKRQVLDEMFSKLKLATDKTKQPSKGWIAEIRSAIGMRADQLAKRLGIAQSALSQLETSERAGSITIKSLQRAAESLDCEFRYFIIPKRGLQQQLIERAQRIVQSERKRVATSMALESQRPPDVVGNTIEAATLINSLDRRLWDD